MELHFALNIDESGQESTLAIPVFIGDTFSDLDEGPVKAAVSSVCARLPSTSKLLQVTPLFTQQGRDIVLVGAGERDEANPVTVERVFAAGARSLTAFGGNNLSMLDRGVCSPAEFGRAAVQGAVMGPYSPGLKKTKHDAAGRMDALCVVSGRDQDAVRQGSRTGQIVGESANVARDLVNLPPNDLTPTAFGERVRREAEAVGMSCTLLDTSRMRDLGMGAILGVAAGSEQPPMLIQLELGDMSASTRLALVGKGLTFDSGGLSIKTAEGMETMKGDMGGGAAVVGAMLALAKLKLANISVRAYVGATENMPGGGAMRPGDVLTAMTGETIEVLNTDAEGRLVLADLLAYAEKEGATHIVDFATLTGGAVVALGHAATLATGRPLTWVQTVVECAETGLERAWPMPMLPEYRSAIDSDVADIKNVGGRGASALTAAAFLGDFVEQAEWAHLDIAGTSWESSPSVWRAQGGTGSGVGTGVAVAQKLASQAHP